MAWWYTETATELYNLLRGFAKKVLLLITTRTYGYCNKYEIATNSHVTTQAVMMDWLCKNYGTIKEKRYPPHMEPLEANMMLEELFDENVWMLMNDMIDALAQYENINANMIDEALQNFKLKHREEIHRFRHGKHEMEPITTIESKQIFAAEL